MTSTLQTTGPTATDDRLKTRARIRRLRSRRHGLELLLSDVQHGIPAAALLWLIPLVRAFGAFDNVTMCLIADRTNTRWGKFRPYLLFGAVPYRLCGCLMFAGPGDAAYNGHTWRSQPICQEEPIALANYQTKWQ